MYCWDLDTRNAEFVKHKDTLQKAELTKKLTKTINKVLPVWERDNKRLKMWASYHKK